MGIATATEPFYSGLQGKIARDSFPDKMERVVGKPHIFTAAGHKVGSRHGIKRCRAWFGDSSYVRLVVENAKTSSPRSSDTADE